MTIFRSWGIGSIDSIRIWALWTVRLLDREFSLNSPLHHCIPQTYYKRDNFIFNISLHTRTPTKLLSLIRTTCIDLGTFLDTKISSMGFLLYNNHKTSKWRGSTIYGPYTNIHIFIYYCLVYTLFWINSSLLSLCVYIL